MWSFNKKFEKIFKNKKNGKFYECIFDHKKNDWIYTHRLVANYFKLLNEHSEHIFSENHQIKNTFM